ncbi:OprO/OprP family phosphate-selective porin [Tundrisphaera sp. TA3]|uniref:OprO/OprP family phosphate-selective porin n=1 Tax=Tundrisphaera sp. TA3 TaxID=3435775 RepID=UPI003EB732CF
MGRQNRRRIGRIVACLVFALAPRVPADEPAPPQPTAAGAEADGRIQELERENRRLADQLEGVTRRHGEQIEQLLKEVAALRESSSAPKEGGESAPKAEAAPAPRPGAGANVGGASDQPGGRRSPIPGYNAVSGSKAQKKVPLGASFGPGFELMSDDEEFQLQVHQETQLDFKEFDPNGDQYARSGFVFPRVRLFFNGRVTKPWEYTVSLNRGLGSIDILDAFVNYHQDDRLQIKAGRFMTPFNYEQFAIQNMWLVTPERSLFTANLGLNRMLGVQAWGNVLEKKLDYAVGVFNGPRNSFEDFNEAKDVMLYLNARPFGGQEEGRPLRNLNLGGSFTYGTQDNPLVPRAFRTASNASNASAADLLSPPFFVFDPDVVERGQRTFWSAHAAYFFRQFSAFADYNGGLLRYARKAKAPDSVDLPTSGISASFGYFLTGETPERRTVLEPLRPFNLSREKFGLGAFELAFRYSSIELDRAAFDARLANPNFWSNRAWITDLGVNWYLTRYLKMYVAWQHSEFGSPILYRRPDRRQLTNELFWLRMQLYF